MHTDEILKQIDELPGMGDFKALCHRLHTAADNARRLHLERAPLPNLIFAAAPGSGVTLHISLMAQLLRSLHLLPFTGEEPYFEWALTDEENAFDRFLLRVRMAGGFYGQFCGVIGLDLTAVVSSKGDPQALTRLMEYIEAHQGRIMFIFIIPDTVPERTAQLLLNRFASITPAELIRMPFPAAEAKSFLVGRLRQRGFTLTDKACTILEEAVSRLSQTSEFEGYQTLINLVEDIIWRRLSSGSILRATITGDDLSFIFAEGGFGSRLCVSPNRNNPRRLGFGASLEA